MEGVVREEEVGHHEVGQRCAHQLSRDVEDRHSGSGAGQEAAGARVSELESAVDALGARALGADCR